MADRDDAPADAEEMAKLKEVPRLVNAYAGSRSSGVLLVRALAALALAVGVGTAVRLLGPRLAGDERNLLILIAAAIVAACGAALLLWLDPTGAVRRLGCRLYLRDGQMRPLRRCVPGTRRRTAVIWGIFGACLAAEATLLVLGRLPIELAQPVSALYVVPILVLMIRWRALPTQSSMMALWPALYALHAILVLLDAPVLRAMAAGEHMLVATFGYGAAGAILSYAHSRAVLRRLRALPGSERTPHT